MATRAASDMTTWTVEGTSGVGPDQNSSPHFGLRSVNHRPPRTVVACEERFQMSNSARGSLSFLLTAALFLLPGAGQAEAQVAVERAQVASTPSSTFTEDARSRLSRCDDFDWTSSR